MKKGVCLNRQTLISANRENSFYVEEVVSIFEFRIGTLLPFAIKLWKVATYSLLFEILSPTSQSFSRGSQDEKIPDATIRRRSFGARVESLANRCN